MKIATTSKYTTDYVRPAQLLLTVRIVESKREQTSNQPKGYKDLQRKKI